MRTTEEAIAALEEERIAAMAEVHRLRAEKAELLNVLQEIINLDQPQKSGEGQFLRALWKARSAVARFIPNETEGK